MGDDDMNNSIDNPVMLYDIHSPILIIKDKHGMYYCNQVNGCSCYQCVTKGFLMPLPYSKYIDDILIDENYNYSKSIKEVWNDWIKKTKYPLELRPYEYDDDVSFDITSENNWGNLLEAWIPVRITKITETYDMIYQFQGMDAIMTYRNSD